MQDLNEAEVVRISELLKTAIRLAGTDNRKVERRLGLCGGYLNRLFSGGIELKINHVLKISAAIDLDPGEFLQIAFPPRKDLRSPTGRKLLDLVSRIQAIEPAPAAPAPAPSPAVSSQQIEEMIGSAVGKVFAELGRLWRSLPPVAAGRGAGYRLCAVQPPERGPRPRG